MRKSLKLVIGAVALAAVAAVGAFLIYLNFIHEDAEPRLELTDSTAPLPTNGSSDTTVAGDSPASIDGTWTVGAGSTAGYRAKEVLFGVDTEATGRTEGVTGSIEISGTAVTTGSFEVDMTTIESGEDRRDEAYRGRIMEVDTFPTSTFVLSAPIEFGAAPEDGVPLTAQAVGDITIHGVTKNVTIDLDAQKLGDTIEVVGALPVKWSDYEINDPSGGPATVTDNGEMEFKLVLAR